MSTAGNNTGGSSTGRALTRLRTGLERYARRKARGDDPLPPPQVLVQAPGVRLEFGDLERRFHCASIDKVMTAAAVGQQVESGRLRFDAPLGTVLPAADLVGLPAADGVDLGTDVTIDHLLSHASGLPDYFDPPRPQAVEASMIRAVRAPERLWTRAEILDQVRTMRPAGRPGEQFGYSDTAYVLLGRVLEEVTGVGYTRLLAERIFAPLGMEASSAPFDDDFTPTRLHRLNIAQVWAGRHEVSRRACLSLSWGSVVTTAADLVRFQQSLHGGELLQPGTLAHITRPRNRMRAGIHYGAGAVTLRFGEFMPLMLRGLPEPVGGLGLSATHMFYYPRQQAHVVLNFHKTTAMSSSFRAHIAIARMLARDPVRGPSVTRGS